ncbi:MAG: SDR family oxidoreductase [Candidatus Eremiobacterota bacterium]
MPSKQPTALLTGSTLGIGRELAHIFARNRHDLILVARNLERLEEQARQIERTYSVRAFPISQDLSRPDAAYELFGRLPPDVPVDILVNNAGFGLFGEFAACSLEEHTAMLRLNIEAVTQLCHLALQEMLRRGRGRILNVASTAAFQPGPYLAVYYATKAYVLSLSEALHQEVRGTGVTVTTLCPGVVPTQFQERAGMKVRGLLLATALDARTVAERGYRGMMEGRRLVIPGRLNQLLATLVKLAPRSLVVELAARLNRGR